MVTLSLDTPLLTLKEVAAYVRHSYTTVHAWTKYGHNGLFLEAAHFPGKTLVPMTAIQAFMEQYMAMEQADHAAPPKPRSETKRQRIKRELKESHGI